MNNDIREAAALVEKHGANKLKATAKWMAAVVKEGYWEDGINDVLQDAGYKTDIVIDAALLAAREDEAGMIQSALADAREETMLAERERCAEILLAKQTELDDEVERLCGSDAHVHEYFFCGDASVMIGFLVDAIRNPQAASNE